VRAEQTNAAPAPSSWGELAARWSALAASARGTESTLTASPGLARSGGTRSCAVRQMLSTRRRCLPTTACPADTVIDPVRVHRHPVRRPTALSAPTCLPYRWAEPARRYCSSMPHLRDETVRAATGLAHDGSHLQRTSMAVWYTQDSRCGLCAHARQRRAAAVTIALHPVLRAGGDACNRGICRGSGETCEEGRKRGLSVSVLQLPAAHQSAQSLDRIPRRRPLAVLPGPAHIGQWGVGEPGGRWALATVGNGGREGGRGGEHKRRLRSSSLVPLVSTPFRLHKSFSCTAFIGFSAVFLRSARAFSIESHPAAAHTQALYQHACQRSSPASRATLLFPARYQTRCGYCGGYTPGVLCPGVLPPAAVTFAAARGTGVVSSVLAVFAGCSTSGDP
jgi:hypothetical protein